MDLQVLIMHNVVIKLYVQAKKKMKNLCWLNNEYEVPE